MTLMASNHYINHLLPWITIFNTFIMFYTFPQPLSFNLQHSSHKHVFSRVESSVDPDQMALSEPSRSGSTVFSKKDKSRFSRTRVKIVINK